MSDSPSHLPRPGDLPRKELVALADKAIFENGGPGKVSVHFKFTCIWCGERCTIIEANTLYEKGECGNCHKETEILFGGMMLKFKLTDDSDN